MNDLTPVTLQPDRLSSMEKEAAYLAGSSSSFTQGTVPAADTLTLNFATLVADPAFTTQAITPATAILVPTDPNGSTVRFYGTITAKGVGTGGGSVYIYLFRDGATVGGENIGSLPNDGTFHSGGTDIFAESIEVGGGLHTYQLGINVTRGSGTTVVTVTNRSLYWQLARL